MQRQLFINMPVNQIQDLVNNMSRLEAVFELHEMQKCIYRLDYKRSKSDKIVKAQQISQILKIRIAELEGVDEYIDLLAMINKCRDEGHYHQDFLSAAVSLANTFRTAQTAEEKAINKQILKCATDILENNTAENQAKLMQFIEKNQEGKYDMGFIKGGAIAFFISLAIIAAGIAVAATGILAPLGAALITLGVLSAAVSVGAFSVGFLKTGKAEALSTFHTEAHSSLFAKKCAPINSEDCNSLPSFRF